MVVEQWRLERREDVCKLPARSPSQMGHEGESCCFELAVCSAVGKSHAGRMVNRRASLLVLSDSGLSCRARPVTCSPSSASFASGSCMSLALQSSQGWGAWFWGFLCPGPSTPRRLTLVLWQPCNWGWMSVALGLTSPHILHICTAPGGAPCLPGEPVCDSAGCVFAALHNLLCEFIGFGQWMVRFPMRIHRDNCNPWPQTL